MSDQEGAATRRAQDAAEMVDHDAHWVRHLLEMFPPNALERLTRADYDYTSTHGEYLPGLARLALFYRAELSRAVYVAEHLEQMIDRETWRSTGGDDGQGHYEGDYRAEQIHAAIVSWKELAAAASVPRARVPEPAKEDE